MWDLITWFESFILSLRRGQPPDMTHYVHSLFFNGTLLVRVKKLDMCMPKTRSYFYSLSAREKGL